MDDRQRPPTDPVAAATHADPYPYYARLVEERPLYHDERLGCWVASGEKAVTAVLTSGACRVRPAAEPVPAALVATDAGELFARFIRMNDREGRCALKQAAIAAIDSIAPSRVERATNDCARSLLESGRDLSDYCVQLPAHTMAALLGVGSEERAYVAQWVGDLAGCFSVAATAAHLEKGEAAARALVPFFRSLIADPTSPDGLLKALASEMHHIGCDDLDVAIANGIGFLFQAYDATAGLVANTFLALSRHDCEWPAPDDPGGAMQAVVDEVLRYDSPVQNTRRYVAETSSVLGRPIGSGDVVLVLLAAAGRDPMANPHPTRFDASRQDRRIFTFGIGGHVCPGQSLATLIAAAGVDRALASGVDLKRIGEGVRYRPSPNVRIPIFNGQVF